MTKSQIFLLSLALTSTAQADWSFQQKPYEMDQNKEACSVSTSTQHNDLEFIFPKDKVGFPIIKMTNKFDREYIASRLYLANSRVRFFGKDDSGQSEFYMVPSSANELETFLGVVKRNSKLKIEKLYLKNRSITASTGDFSLSGSSKALNQLKDCLSGSFLSQSQKDLISSISQRSFRAGQTLSSSYRENMNLGLKIYQGIQGWNANNEDYALAQAAVEEKRNDPEYRELKKQKEDLDTAVRRTDQAQKQIAANEDFFENADEVISSLEARQKSESSKAETLKIEIEALEAQIDSHQAQIDSLNLIVNDENEAAQAADAEVKNLNSQISKARENVSELSTALRESTQRQASMRGQSIDLERNMNDAKWRSDNSRQIKRETEQALYRDYGGQPFEIELEIEGLSNDFKTTSAKAQKASQYKDHMDQIVSLGSKVKSFNPGISRIQAELNCFKNSEGAAIKNCLTTSMSDIERRINQMIAERRGHESDRCRFPIGRKRCKRKRQERIDAVNARLAVVEKEKTDLQARIKIIETTGTDPQKAQTIAGLTTKVNDLRTKRKNAIAETQRKINQIVNRDIRIFPSMDRVKKCVVTAREFCEKVAASSAARLQQTFQRDSDRAEELRKAREDRSLALRNLNNAIRTQVDGIETRLFEEYRAARTSYEENALALDREVTAQRSIGMDLEAAQSNLGTLNVRVGGAEERARQAASRESQASRDVINYKRRVGFDSLAGSLDEKRRAKNEASSRASQLSKDSASARERKLRVEGEINGYPARKDILAEEMAAHERGLDEILFPLQGHLDQLNALEATARTARSKNVEAQEFVRSSIGMIRNKY